MRKTTIVFFALIFFISVSSGRAQKGLYIGGGFGYCSLGGELANVADDGGGLNALVGFKVTNRIGVELEFHASELKSNSDAWEKTAFAGLAFNLKKFFAGPRQAFKPYFIGGFGVSSFAWEYTPFIKGLAGEEGDGIAALSIAPGFGAELMVGRIAALNMCGRFFLNAWGDETKNGHEPEYDSGNTLLVNFGLILHL